MTNAEIELHVEGPAAEDLAMELSELLELRLGATIRVERPPSPDGVQHRGIDPALAVSVLSLVVSLPSTVLSTIQLVEWLQKRRAAASAAPREGEARTVRIAVRGSDETLTLHELDARAAVEQLAPAGNESPKP